MEFTVKQKVACGVLALGLGIYITGCSRGSSTGFAEGYASGQNDLYSYLDTRVKTLTKSLTQNALEQHLQLNLTDLENKNHPSLDSPEYKEVIATFLALHQKARPEKQ